MIDPLGGAAVSWPQAPQAANQKVLRMVTSDRTAGSMPRWERATTAEQTIEQTLAQAVEGRQELPGGGLSYRPENPAGTQGGEFGFRDFLDMINPLQHIPVLNHIYRGVTGDKIRPISQIIGGAVFGGPLGAAGSLVNVIVQEETGKDIAGNALALAMNGEGPRFKSNGPDNPQDRLNEAVRLAQGGTPHDLPGSLLAFADMRHDSGILIERIDDEARKKNRTTENIYPAAVYTQSREPITRVSLDPQFSEIY